MEKVLLHLRDQLNKSLESRRLFHGRGKAFSPYDYFNIELYFPYIVLVFYKEFEPNLINGILDTIKSTAQSSILGIMLQKRHLPYSPMELLDGEMPNEAHILIENNQYAIKFGQSQNLGFFLDNVLGREYLSLHSAEKKILNLFAYTSSLSVVALKSNAQSVVNFDMSKAAIRRSKLNHQLNNIDLRSVKFFDHDIFKSLGKIERLGPYDIVIIDPPLDHGDHFKLIRDYPKLIARSYRWLTKGGKLMTFLNSPHHDFSFLRNLVEEQALNFRLINQMGLPNDFLETDPEHGLKILVWEKYE
jgi:23S rRNA (cytosine1962-C5)-methyltransferase